MNQPIPHEELISGYLDGELTTDEQALVERLLVENDEFRQLFEELKTLRSRLQALPTQEPSPDLTHFVMARAELELAAQGGLPDAFEQQIPVDLQPKSPTVAASIPKVTGHNDWRRLLIGAVGISALVLLAFVMMPRQNESPHPRVAQAPPEEGLPEEQSPPQKNAASRAYDDENADTPSKATGRAARDMSAASGLAPAAPRKFDNRQAKDVEPLNRNIARGGSPAKGQGAAQAERFADKTADPSVLPDEALQAGQVQQFQQELGNLAIDGLDANVYVVELQDSDVVGKLKRLGIPTSNIHDGSAELKQLKSTAYSRAYLIDTTRVQLDAFLRGEANPALLSLRSPNNPLLAAQAGRSIPGGRPLAADGKEAQAGPGKLDLAEGDDDKVASAGTTKRYSKRVANGNSPNDEGRVKRLEKGKSTPAATRAKRPAERELANKARTSNLAEKLAKTQRARSQDGGAGNEFSGAKQSGFGGGGAGLASRSNLAGNNAALGGAGPDLQAPKYLANDTRRKSGYAPGTQLMKVLTESESLKVESLVQNTTRALVQQVPRQPAGDSLVQEMKKASLDSDRVVVLFLVAKPSTATAKSKATPVTPSAPSAKKSNSRAGDRAKNAPK